MQRRLILALAGAILAVVLAPASAALATPGPTVKVRIEGKKRNLLAPTVVHTHTGSITKGGAPNGACSATSAAGALDAATRHRWTAKYSTSQGDEFITKILGGFASGRSYFWAIFVNNQAASTGACAIKLHDGDHLLFAAVSVTSIAYPLALSAPHTASVGHTFKAKVVWWTAAGKRKPLAGARVHAVGLSLTTNNQGIALITPTHSGTLVLHADQNGYVRAVPVRVRVNP